MRRTGPVVFAAVLLSASAALGAAPHAAHEPPSIGSLFLPLLNFVMFVALFWYFAWPLLRDALLERRRVVERELAESERLHREAAALRAEVEARRARVKEEGARLVEELRAQAQHDRERLVEAARKTAERIRADARLLAEQEAKRAAHGIREEVAERVVALVVAALRERLTREDDQRFVREFVAAVESGELR